MAIQHSMRYQLATAARLTLPALLGASIVVGGVAIMLQGTWVGIVLVLSGAVLMAVPAALCTTHFLCEKLYGATSPASPHTTQEPLDAPATPYTRRCSTCQVVRAWFTAEFHGNHLPFWELMGMRNRGTPPDIIVNAYVILQKDDNLTSIPVLEDLYITEQSRIHDTFDLVHLVTGLKD